MAEGDGLVELNGYPELAVALDLNTEEVVFKETFEVVARHGDITS